MPSQEDVKKSYSDMFHVKVRYLTDLPSVPHPPIVLEPSVPYIEGKAAYQPTSLEQHWPYASLTRWDVGGGGFPSVELGDFNTVAEEEDWRGGEEEGKGKTVLGMKKPEQPMFDPRDIALLGEHAKELGVDAVPPSESASPSTTDRNRHSRRMDPALERSSTSSSLSSTEAMARDSPKRNVTWMRRTQYIALERPRSYASPRGQDALRAEEEGGGASLRDVSELSGPALVEGIDESFRIAASWSMDSPPAHPKSKTAKPVSIMTLLPETSLEDLILCTIEAEPEEIKNPTMEQGPLSQSILLPNQGDDTASAEARRPYMSVYKRADEGKEGEEQNDDQEIKYQWFRDYTRGQVGEIKGHQQIMLTLQEKAGTAHWGLLNHRLELKRRPFLPPAADPTDPYASYGAESSEREKKRRQLLVRPSNSN
ncbi:MAG: hypothetical protein DHS80DRAFT_24414 [Piptocephalis tieghemiana]|nr:MAG: hypothetical protein DHS80DRAFT_24414 [Piptocephalis tieghemiana]